LPEIAAEVTVAFECSLDALLRADAPFGLLTSLALLENIRKTSTPAGKRMFRSDPGRQFPGSLNLSRKTIILTVAKGSAREQK